MSTLDSSMVNIALPVIMKQFHSPLPVTEWVVLIYLLTITSSLLFWGHISDRFGRGRIYAGGMFIFALGSLACAVSPSLVLLIFSRLVQAVGAAMMMSTGPALIREIFPAEQLGRALGMIGISVSLGLMTGPSVGGFLLDLFSWRAMFLITVPIGIIFFFLAVRILPRTRHHRGAPIDWFGSLCWALFLSLVSLAISHATSTAWSIGRILLFLLPAGIFFIIFMRIEKKTGHPLLPLELFRQRFFIMGALSAVLSFMTLFSVIMLTPFYLDHIRQLPSATIGLVMMAIPASIFIAAPLAGWLSDKVSSRRFIPTCGLLLSTLGLLLLSQITAGASLSSIGFRLALLGCGQAIFLSPNSSAVLSAMETTRVGTAAALLATSRNLGMLLGIGQSALVFSIVFASLTGGLDMKDFTPAHIEQFMSALKGAFWIAAITGIIGSATSWLRE